MKPIPQRLLCALAGSLFAAGAINPACGKPGFVDIISVAPQPFWSTLKLFRAEPKVSLILLAPSFITQGQPDYAAVNGVDFSALAGFNDNSSNGFAPIVIVNEKTNRESAPANVDPGSSHKSFAASGPSLADNWSRIAGVGSTIPSYTTGSGVVSDNSSATPDSSQSQLAGSDVRQRDRETDQTTSTVTKDSTQSVPLAGPDRGSQSLRDGGSVSIGGITLAGDASKVSSIQHVTPKALTIGGPAPDAATAIRTWQGGPGGNANDWTRTQNWSPNGQPTSTDTAQFDNTANSGNLAPTIAGTNTSVGSILFASGTTNAYTISGTATLTIGSATVAGITNASATNQQLSVSTIALGIAQSWDVQSTGNLSLSSAVSLGSNLLTLTGSSSGAGSISGIISGTGGLTKSGTGIWTLSGTNNFTGTTNISAGALTITNSSALGSTANGTSLASGAVLRIDGTSGNLSIGAETLTLNGVGLIASPAGALRNIAGNNSWAGAITLGSASSIQSDAGTLTLTGGINNAGFLATFQGAGNTTVSTTKITRSGGLTKNGGGTLTLSAANDYSGGTTLSAGTLTLSGSGQLGSTTGALTVNGGTLNLGGTSQTVGALSGSGGTINTSTGSSTLTVGNGGGSGSYSGTIANGSGTVSLTKTGGGTETLSGANTYTGPTTVSAGTLLVNGNQSSATGAVAVNNSGTVLGGAGTIGGAVTVASGATIAPGATGNGSTAILKTGALTLSSSSNFSLDLNGTVAGTSYDQLSVTGTVSIGGSNLLINSISGLSVNDKLFILANDSTDAISGTFAGLAQGGTISSGGYTLTIDYMANFMSGSANDISLTVTAVPEPGSWLAGALALLAVGYTQRRRFQRKAVFVSAG
jgi:autotransporter-associated beta strand protein